MGAFCPHCGRDSQIIETRKIQQLASVVRTRRCSQGHKWPTIELQRERVDALLDIERHILKYKETPNDPSPARRQKRTVA